MKIPSCLRLFLSLIMLVPALKGQQLREVRVLALQLGDEEDTSGTRYEGLKRSGFLAADGTAVFTGTVPDRSGTRTVRDLTALWKTRQDKVICLAREGDPAPGLPGMVFGSLPEIVMPNAAGEVTFSSTVLPVPGEAAPPTTPPTVLWSELGGQGLRPLLRQGLEVPGLTGSKLLDVAAAVFPTARLADGSGVMVLPARLSPQGAVLLRLRVPPQGPAQAEILAQEGMTTPDSPMTFKSLIGPGTDPVRMNAQGQATFEVGLAPRDVTSLWFAPLDGPLKKIAQAGDAASGTRGAVFSRIHKSSLGADGRIAFRAFLSTAGDNAGNNRTDGIWSHEGTTGIQPLLRCGDSGLPGMPKGSKVGNVWSSWLGSQGGAWKAWLDVNGNGVSQAPADVHALFSSLTGPLKLVLKQGDPAPDVPNASLASFDLPVVGGDRQMAFLGELSGEPITSANDIGLWRQEPRGGMLKLVLRTGDEIQTSAGRKVVSSIDLPGARLKERRWEQPVMDAQGRILVLVRFGDGLSAQVLVP